tara:strand:+ start:5002 stop:5301 length:300 start_codon:yes stop_codon:yes gene_type:complete
MALFKVVIAITPYEEEETDEVGQPMDLPTEFLTKYVVTDEEEMISSIIIHELVDGDYFYGVKEITKICEEEDVYVDGLEQLINIANHFRNKIKLRHKKY